MNRAYLVKAPMFPFAPFKPSQPVFVQLELLCPVEHAVSDFV